MTVTSYRVLLCNHIHLIFLLSLGIEDLIVRVVIVGVILTFRSLTQEALEMVCGLLLENHGKSSCSDYFDITLSYRFYFS